MTSRSHRTLRRDPEDTQG